MDILQQYDTFYTSFTHSTQIFYDVHNNLHTFYHYTLKFSHISLNNTDILPCFYLIFTHIYSFCLCITHIHTQDYLHISLDEYSPLLL